MELESIDQIPLKEQPIAVEPVAPASVPPPQEVAPVQLTIVNVPIIESAFIRRYFVTNSTDHTAFLKFNIIADNSDTLNIRLNSSII